MVCGLEMSKVRNRKTATFKVYKDDGLNELHEEV